MPSLLSSSKLNKNLKDDLFSEIEEMTKIQNQIIANNSNNTSDGSKTNNNNNVTPCIDTMNREMLHTMMDINRVAAMGIDSNFIQNIEVSLLHMYIHVYMRIFAYLCIYMHIRIQLFIILYYIIHVKYFTHSSQIVFFSSFPAYHSFFF